MTGSDDNNIIVSNFKPQIRPFKLSGHKGAINEVAISPDSKLIASASSDATVRVWSNVM